MNIARCIIGEECRPKPYTASMIDTRFHLPDNDAAFVTHSSESKIMDNNFYSKQELLNLGFASVGTHVFISKKASIYNPDKINIGSNVRIDDFCLLSGKITIGNFIHIAAYTSLCGGSAGITLADFVNLSRKIEIFAISDDFSGETMTNPMVPEKFKNILNAPVLLHKHVLVGTSSVILPGVTLEEGCVVGALSLVKNSLPAWTINAGIPARTLHARSKSLLGLEKTFLETNSHA